MRHCCRQLRGDGVILTGVSAVGEPLTAHQLLSLASLGLRQCRQLPGMFGLQASKGTVTSIRARIFTAHHFERHSGSCSSRRLLQSLR